ncbi:MAG: helix-turn-helix transcriptional regulator [Tannerellaceae bacterium]|nr:helix-turn-helix transcriptional regulator [Tannerellaceae bacterium]
MFQTISFIAAFQSLFFAVLIITKKNKSVLDKHLSGWLILLTVNIVCISLSQNENLSYSGYLVYPGYILSGLHGFFLYLCTKSLSSFNLKKFKREYFIAIVYGILILIGFVLNGFYPQPAAIISRSVAFLFNVFFIVLAVRLFHYYKRFLETNFSNVDKVSFDWMRFLAFGLIILLGGALILVILHEFFSFSLSLYSAFSVIVLLFVNILGFRGIKYSTLFNQIVIQYNQPKASESDELPVNKDNSYANYGLKQDDAIILSEKLTLYMQKEKPYLHMDLTLKDLASALDTYPHYITQVLNTVFNQNFYDFINSYRIEEVKERLLDSQYQNLTVLAIAYDCGFNSKSTFNRIFKQKTGFTPTQYRN